MDDLQQREGPAWALAEDTTETQSDRAANARQATTPWEPIYDAWKSDERRRIASGTLKNYDAYVRKTLQHIDKPFEDVGYLDLTSYRDNWEEEFEDRVGRPLHRGSINTWISALRSLYAFAIDKLDLPIRNVARKLDRPSHDVIERERKDRTPIPREVYADMVERAVQAQDYDWAVAAKFAWQAIARISEVHNLRWRDIDFEQKLVVVREPKAGPPKEKVLYGPLLDDLRWLKGRHYGEPDPESFVFHEDGLSLSAFRGRFDRRLKAYAKAAGFDHFVHPHLVRHSAPTALSAAGVPTRDIMDQGGWESESSLKHYIHVETDARRDRLRGTLDL